MIRLMRYLKPYIASIVLIVALLFLQANADLALPDYMSRIVNTGIQQGGIEDSLPQAMGGNKFDMVLQIVSPEEGATILAAYDRFEPGSEAHQALLKKYPNAGSEPLYILKKIDATTRSRLNALMVGAISSRLTGIDPSIVTQMGVQAVKGEYERLGMDTVALQTSYILSVGGLMLLLTLLSVVATVIVGFLGARTAAGFARDLRVNLFRKVENFSFAELDKFSTASLITRSTNDITQMQMVTVMGLRMFFYAPIIGIGGVIRATGKASSMWWIIALAVSIILGVIAVVFAIALPKFKSIQKLIDKLNLVVRENLSGMMVIRAFAMQGEEEKRFDKANRDLTGTMLFVTRVMVVLMPLMMLIMNLVSLLIVWTGAKEVALSQIRVGDMMAFMQYAMQIFFSFIMLSMMFIILPRASVSADRIAEVLATEPSIVDPKTPLVYGEDFKGLIEFKDVSFRYPGATENVLSKISFTAKPGQTTAVIGTTGSGKSTLVSLIPRFYDVCQGSITLDGHDI
ncbi:MAG: ABC transporter, partial [Candidatus Melainabacteria bacterium HGW-Melainabacteria-1]